SVTRGARYLSVGSPARAVRRSTVRHAFRDGLGSVTIGSSLRTPVRTAVLPADEELLEIMQIVAIVVSLAFTVVGVALTARAVQSMLGVIRKGQPAPGRTGNPVGRTLTMVKETFGHTRMLQWTWVGILHWFAFAAFLVLSTAVAQAFFQLFDPEFAYPIIGHWIAFEWVSEFIGLLGALAILPLFVYRVLKRPSKDGRGSRFFGSTMWQAYFVEAMVFLESSAILFIRAAEYKYI